MSRDGLREVIYAMKGVTKYCGISGRGVCWGRAEGEDAGGSPRDQRCCRTCRATAGIAVPTNVADGEREHAERAGREAREQARTQNNDKCQWTHSCIVTPASSTSVNKSAKSASRSPPRLSKS